VIYVGLFLRAALIVSLTSWNVRHIGALNYPGAGFGGFWISFVWWGNSGAAARNTQPYAREVYAAGAALGTMVGMYLGR
jgi:hypothetical protein